MPPRWSRKPDRKDPDYRRLDDRMNFAVHVAIFAATNSGLWFFRTLQHQPWSWAPTVTLGWLALLVTHLVYIAAIANYSEPATVTPAAGVGFQPKVKEKGTKSTK